MSFDLVMPFSHLILSPPLLLLPSNFTSIRVFSNESVLCIRWPKYWSFSFSISPSNEYSGLISFRTDWLDLVSVQGTQESSPTPQFKSINSLVLSLLYSPTLTFIHDYWKNHCFDWTDLIQGLKRMNLILKHLRDLPVSPSFLWLSVSWRRKYLFRGRVQTSVTEATAFTSCLPGCIAFETYWQKSYLPSTSVSTSVKWVPSEYPQKSWHIVSRIETVSPVLLNRSFPLFPLLPTPIQKDSLEGLALPSQTDYLIFLLTSSRLLGIKHIKISYWHCCLFGARDISSFSNLYKPGLGFHPQPDLKIIMHYQVGIHFLVLFWKTSGAQEILSSESQEDTL